MIVTAAWRRNNSWGTLIDLLCGYRVITSMENIKVFLITSIEIINIVFLSLSISLSNDLIIYLPVCIFYVYLSYLLWKCIGVFHDIVILYTSEHSILFGNRKMTLNYF